MQKSKPQEMNGKGKIYAAIDTNVLVSSLFSSDGTSNPSKVINAVLKGIITPLYNSEIIEEYRDVLSRAKFRLDTDRNLLTVLCLYLSNAASTRHAHQLKMSISPILMILSFMKLR